MMLTSSWKLLPWTAAAAEIDAVAPDAKSDLSLVRVVLLTWSLKLLYWWTAAAVEIDAVAADAKSDLSLAIDAVKLLYCWWTAAALFANTDDDDGVFQFRGTVMFANTDDDDGVSQLRHIGLSLHRDSHSGVWNSVEAV